MTDIPSAELSGVQGSTAKPAGGEREISPLAPIESSGALLQLSSLTVQYHAHGGVFHRESPPPAVKEVSFDVGQGCFVALVGESGSGKTSIANAVLGLAPISSGSVRLAGAELAGLRRRRARAARRAVQLIMQDPFESLDPLYSVRALVEEPLLVHEHGLEKAARRARVDAALAAVGLHPVEEFSQRRPHELSGGQRQRVSIAAALIVEPRLLIADEPVSMLDVSVRAEILHLLDELRVARQMGILMITHDLPTALAFCGRVIVMRRGEIVADGSPDEIRGSAPQAPYTRELLAATPGRVAAAGSARGPSRGAASSLRGAPHPSAPHPDDAQRSGEPPARAPQPSDTPTRPDRTR